MTTPTPALRSALRTALEDRYKFDVHDETLDYILARLTPFLAPAPVEQARGEQLAVSAIRALEQAHYITMSPSWTPLICEQQRERMVDLLTRHFQSLATEKPTSSPGETGGEATVTKGPTFNDSSEGNTRRKEFEAAQSQTPMTDAAEKNHAQWSGEAPDWCIPSAFARTLELENRHLNGVLAEEAALVLKLDTRVRTLETALAAANAKARDSELDYQHEKEFRLMVSADRDALAEKLRRCEGELDTTSESLSDWMKTAQRRADKLTALQQQVGEADPEREFARSCLRSSKEAVADGSMSEEDEATMECAARLGYGNVRKVIFDPKIHGDVGDAEPGAEIWFWGAPTVARLARQPDQGERK